MSRYVPRAIGKTPAVQSTEGTNLVHRVATSEWQVIQLPERYGASNPVVRPRGPADLLLPGRPTQRDAPVARNALSPNLRSGSVRTKVNQVDAEVGS
jgi:hypothetical protein